RDTEAIQEYRGSIPALLGGASETDDEDATVRLTADQRLETVLEFYVALLARSNVSNRIEESLRVVEVIPSRSVQNAISASAERVAARAPGLADLVRREQDLRKQTLAQAGLLSNVLAEPPERRQESTVKELQQELEKLRMERQAARRQIEYRF